MRPSCTVSTSFAISTSLRAARSGLAKGLYSTNFMVRAIAAFNWMCEYRHATRPRIDHAFDTHAAGIIPSADEPAHARLCTCGHCLRGVELKGDTSLGG